jgi:prepilin-type N-terminal cleavage/methylation domain-containing protein/prepilin-type processing-associated H-X9-DG protein
MHGRKQGFTLIELLVVIAIIAILAAILFPVFAQAREKARAISCLSNIKQIGTAIQMYTQDYDETYPYGCPNGWWYYTWFINTQPYIQNVNILKCPDDGASPEWSWAGPRVSYASNGYMNWVNGDNAWDLLGVMGMAQGKEQPGGWMGRDTQTMAGVNRPAETIMLTEKLQSENQMWFGPYGVICGIPDSWGWGHSEIPNSTRNPTWIYPQGYPEGPDGAVTPVHNGMANFLFCDSHAKSMKAPQTDPDPVNQPQNNMWDATRQ